MPATMPIPTAQSIPLTRHAERRSNQRGIRAEAMEVLLDHGVSQASRGCEVIYMNQSARRRARAALGRTAYARIERSLDAYLVVASDGAIVTCCHRTQRLKDG